VVDERGVELVVLADYMRLLSERVSETALRADPNVHPSMFSSFPGARLEDALAHGVRSRAQP